ncbi:hydroxyacid dehydrogenase [Candidatus Woesearchaeota archaeon]|nr:hydroxyacid dehydrogenase [Candidatus Woesearchaeota archaeon]
MAKLAFFELEPWEKNYISGKLKKHTLIFVDKELHARNLENIKDIDGLIVFVHSQITADMINKLKKLKLVATMSTGYDHIALDACKQRRIIVCNVPFYGENTVAEYAFALLLSLSRKIHKTYMRTIQGNFSLKELRGFDLKGKTLGVIGTGHIGQHVIAMAKGFEMNVLGYARTSDKKLAKKLGFTYTSLPTLLKKSDIITIHVPYTKETHHLIDKNAVKHMKKGVILINTSRGSVIETEALLYGLKKKIIAGAGLDVLEAESFIQDEKRLLKTRHIESSQLKLMLEDHALLEDDHVLITPHNAFNTTEAIQRIMDTTIDNINQFFSKKKVKNKVV